MKRSYFKDNCLWILSWNWLTGMDVRVLPLVLMVTDPQTIFGAARAGWKSLTLSWAMESELRRIKRALHSAWRPTWECVTMCGTDYGFCYTYLFARVTWAGYAFYFDVSKTMRPKKERWPYVRISLTKIPVSCIL